MQKYKIGPHIKNPSKKLAMPNMFSQYFSKITNIHVRFFTICYLSIVFVFHFLILFICFHIWGNSIPS